MKTTRRIDPAKAAERKARKRELAAKLKALTPEQRQAMAAHIGIRNALTGESYSVNNQCLMILQCPDVSLVGGFQQWRQLGRSVNKGAQGLMVWFPCHPKKADPELSDESGKVFFSVAYVFDISQTSEISLEVSAA